MQNKNITPNFGGRQYFLDWLRVIAFLYLVFYHTGMMFVEWDFHIESGHDSAILKPIMMLTSNWRLDLLFLVSGVAISFMMTKMSVRKFIWQRIIKLFIPATFAIAIIVAPQSYYEALFKGFIEPGFWHFWTTQYFSFSWLDGMIAPFPTYNHMWYVVYLFFYTVFLAPLLLFINSERGINILSWIETWITASTRLLWAPLVPYLAAYFIAGHNNVTHALNDDWFGHFIFSYILVLGIIFVRMPRVWQTFERIRYPSLALALMSYAVILVKYYFSTPLDVVPWDMMEMIIKWSWIATLIGFSRYYLNFTNGFLHYANGIVYPFFILHQTVTIVIGYYIIDWGLNGVAEFLLIAFGTIFISMAMIELMIKPFNFLRLLFGLKTKSKKRNFAIQSRSL